MRVTITRLHRWRCQYHAWWSSNRRNCNGLFQGVRQGHHLLIEKLSRYGIQGHTNRLINNWLSDGTQTVVLEGQRSYTAHVRSDVPQESVLGPCLFLYYINDIPDNVNSKFRLFADDIIMYLAFKDNKSTYSIQDDLDQLAKWESYWQTAFHPEKCQVILA